jgi:hypothetical protein
VDNETVTGSDKERNALVRERRKAAANDLFQKFLREELSDELGKVCKRFQPKLQQHLRSGLFQISSVFKNPFEL